MFVSVMVLATKSTVKSSPGICGTPFASKYMTCSLSGISPPSIPEISRTDPVRLENTSVTSLTQRGVDVVVFGLTLTTLL